MIALEYDKNIFIFILWALELCALHRGGDNFVYFQTDIGLVSIVRNQHPIAAIYNINICVFYTISTDYSMICILVTLN